MGNRWKDLKIPRRDRRPDSLAVRLFTFATITLLSAALMGVLFSFGYYFILIRAGFVDLAGNEPLSAFRMRVALGAIIGGTIAALGVLAADRVANRRRR
jgi:hypothetical protein